MHLLNPLQWRFGPRTVATLLTWAILPATVGIYTILSTITQNAANYGLTAEQTNALVTDLLRQLAILSIPVMLICLLASLLFTWAVVRPLLTVRNAMEQIAQGDLTGRALSVASRDEIGQITAAYNAMASALKGTVAEMATTARELNGAGERLRENASQTGEATRSSASLIAQIGSSAAVQVQKSMTGNQATFQLAEAAEQVAQAADAQAREVESTAATARQVAAAITQVAGSASVVSQVAAHTREAAVGGQKAVGAVTDGMDQVKRRVLDAAQQVQELSANLGHVDGILQLITEIADQTDLLALNAAIEAARVGEHGRGFAVVAGEVRRLSDRSRKAAGEIAVRVDELRSAAAHVVSTIDLGTQDVQRGSLLTREAGEALARILEAVAQTQEQVESISAAAQEISAASDQVVAATHQLSALAEENAATAEEMLAGARGVGQLIAAVAEEAHRNEQGTLAMAAQARQVEAAVAEVGACSDQVMSTATVLHDRVAHFRLQ